MKLLLWERLLIDQDKKIWLLFINCSFIKHIKDNMYTESLGDQVYLNNPKFKKFIADNGLNFRPYEQFGKVEITERIQLSVQFVNLVWNVEMLE